MFSSSNPAMRTNTFAKFRDQLDAQAAAERNVMTIQGTINKTGLLLILVVAAAVYSWALYFSGQVAQMQTVMFAGGVTAFALSFVGIFMKPQAVRFIAPAFAVGEGLFLGGISAYFDAAYPGIVIMATVSTFGVLAVMLTIYKLKLINVNERFKGMVMTAVGSLILVALVSMVTSFFLGFSILHQGGLLGVGISAVIIVIFSLYLLVQFKEIEEGAAGRAPKWVEWYGAFGILIAMVWLYIEILNILSFFSRD